MEKHRAVPEGYMTVGTLANKMGITVPTLHHYDKMGLLSPSSESEGGYRLYSYKDVVKLNQILAMKHLGFSLADIRNRLVTLETPDEVADALSKQASLLHKKIEEMMESLKAVEALRTEVIQMQSVNFKKYADIITQLKRKNEHYWAIKHMDDDLINYAHNASTVNEVSKAQEAWQRLGYEAVQLQKEGILPESEKGQILAKAIWNSITEFTGGDMNLISKFEESINKLAVSKEASSLDDEQEERIGTAYRFMQTALDFYLMNWRKTT